LSTLTARRALALGSALSLALAAPAVASSGHGAVHGGKKPGGAHGGKRPIGEIVSFEDSHVALLLTDGSTVTHAVADDVRVKIERRGLHDRGKGHGNPTTGSIADLAAGARVLRMKLDRSDDIVKIRLRVTSEVAEPEGFGAEMATGDTPHDVSDDEVATDDSHGDVSDDDDSGEDVTPELDSEDIDVSGGAEL
jgi:hypothetical protein